MSTSCCGKGSGSRFLIRHGFRQAYRVLAPDRRLISSQTAVDASVSGSGGHLIRECVATAGEGQRQVLTGAAVRALFGRGSDGLREVLARQAPQQAQQR